MVELSLPGDDDQGVRDPPLSALGGGQRKVRLREAGREDSRERRRVGPGGSVGTNGRRNAGTPAPPQPPNPPGTMVGAGKRASFAVPGYGYVAPGNY